MRRIDAIAISFGFFITGGVIYLILQATGIDATRSGIWTQVVLIAGLLVWTLSYIFRFARGNMTYNQQIKNYEDAVLEKRLAEMTPEEIAKLQAEVETQKKS